MLLEAFFSTVASSVIAEVIKEMIRRMTDRKPTKEKDLEDIISGVLRKYPSLRQSSVIEREIVRILKNAVLVDSGGYRLSPSQGLSALPELLGTWWDGRVYKIVSVASEKALDVPKDQMDNGVRIQQWDYWGGTNQQWKLIPVSGDGGWFKIHSQHSAKVLDVPKSRVMDNGIRIQQWSYWGGMNQHWKIVPIDSTGEIFKILSVQSGKALDMPKDMTNNGITIQQWDYWGGTNQQWRLIRAK